MEGFVPFADCVLCLFCYCYAVSTKFKSSSNKDCYVRFETIYLDSNPSTSKC